MRHSNHFQQPKGAHILGQRDGIDVVDEQERREKQHPYHQEYQQDGARLEEDAQIRPYIGVVDLRALLLTGDLPRGQPLHDRVQSLVYSKAAVKVHHDAQFQFLRHVLSIQRHRRGRPISIAAIETGDNVDSLPCHRLRRLPAHNEKPDLVANGKRRKRFPAEQDLIRRLGKPPLGHCHKKVRQSFLPVHKSHPKPLLRAIRFCRFLPKHRSKGYRKCL